MKTRSWMAGLLVAFALLACSGSYRGGNDGGAGQDGGIDAAGDGTAATDGNVVDAVSEFTPMPGQCQLPQFYSNACQPCVNANCCAQQQQCAQDPDCNAYLLCASKCAHDNACPSSSEASCEQSCSGMYPSGYNKFNTGIGVDSCVYSKCGSSCATSCPP